MKNKKKRKASPNWTKKADGSSIQIIMGVWGYLKAFSLLLLLLFWCYNIDTNGKYSTFSSLIRLCSCYFLSPSSPYSLFSPLFILSLLPVYDLPVYNASYVTLPIRKRNSFTRFSDSIVVGEASYMFYFEKNNNFYLYIYLFI